MHSSPESPFSAEWLATIQAQAREAAATSGLPVEALMPLIELSGAIGVAADPLSNSPAEALGQLSPRLRVVVRDDLLEPLTFFLKLTKGCIALSASTAALFATGPNVVAVGGLAAALTDLFELFRKTWNLAYRLTEVEWAVVSELSRAQRATSQQLATRLQSITVEQVEAVLNKFSVSDRIPKNFTRQQSGQWELVEV